ncbi:MAG: DivIVA domain-containing protein [Solirubrobacteraceae bacterium]
MALDRQSIEKKDFPIGSSGYDPEAVDAHLTAVAAEIAEFKLSARRRNDTLASSASDHVRAIVEAAESSASDIQRAAETEAREIRQEATSEAQATREEAAEQARQHIGKVTESTASMLQRIDAMESELSSLVDTLRTSGNRLDSDLRLLEGHINEVSDAFSSPPRFAREDETPPVEVAPPLTNGYSSVPEAEDAWGAPPDSLSDESSRVGLEEEGMVGAEQASWAGAEQASWAGAEQASAAGTEPGVKVEVDEGNSTPAPEPAAQAESSDDAEGARLIALNMALNGTPRDETAKYLSENFTLSNSDGLLDEVYASVDG